jgi:membrane protein implicated in regulation of membrane protease activity
MLIYGGIALFGVVVLLVMLFLGDVFGGDHDLSHDISVGHGDVDHGGGPSLFSTRVIASFFTAFGVGGIVARYYGLSHPAASGVGIVAGIVMSSVVFQFAKILYSQQASSELRMTGLIGQEAEVSVAIPATGVGQVALTSGGQQSEHIARSADGLPIARGQPVTITGVRGDAVVVSALSLVRTGTTGERR